MMSKNNPRGFVEHRNLAGNVCPSARKRRVKGDGTNANPHQIYAGDPVILVSGNTVVRKAAAATAASRPILGIVRAVHDNNDKPLTFSQPSKGPYLDASTAGWVYVNEDPHQTYLVNTDATVVSTLIGQFVDATADSPGSAAGTSGFEIEVATGTNTAANTVPFQVIGIGANNLDGITGGENNQDVEVIIADHMWHSTNKAR